MSFSSEWNDRYQENTHMSIWPWSDLISAVMKNKPKNENFKVLELGCGAGANIPFFTSLDADYYAIEGSEEIVKKLHKKYPQYKNNIIVGDFTKKIPNEKFDLIIDRASLTHNNQMAINQCLNLCYEQLSNSGKFIGIDWFSTKCSDYKKGKQAEDVWTKFDIEEGWFAGLGKIHFSDKKHLLDLFKKFEIISLAHKDLFHEIPDKNLKFSTWNFVARKVQI
jgi:SAM-dependent methyltransferase